MTQPPNPIAQSLRAILRDPAVWLLEILWRWSFAAVAVLIVFLAGAILLDPVHIDSLARALQTRDPRMIGTTLFFTWLLLGVKAIIAVIAVPLALVIVWTFFVAATRRITARRLRAAPLNFGPMLKLQFVRAIVVWIAYLLVIGSVALAMHMASSSHSDPVVFYNVGVPAIALVLLIWLALNWYLSVAAIFGEEGQGLRAAFRRARQVVRSQRSDFAGTGFVFLFLRLVLLGIVVAILGLTSEMQATAPQSYAMLVIAVALAYFAISDILYVWRMASYVALTAALENDVILQLEQSAPPTGSTGNPAN
ncbi:MAG TPA: hypothetical protein VJW20_05755 [Candidatus Angelobacter sp.]|nr:hypothetical protein [Candidatus Angelobacter sp.]